MVSLPIQTVSAAIGTNEGNMDKIELDSLRITMNMVSATCGNADGSVSALVKGGKPPYSYRWDNGQTTNTASNLSADSYALYVSDSKGNVALTNVNVSNVNAPNIELTHTGLKCFGDLSSTITAKVTGGKSPYTYLWSDGETKATNSGVGSGQYTITVRDGNNCVGLETVILNQPDALVLETKTWKTNCMVANGKASVQVYGGIPPYRYSWTDGQTTKTASKLAAGNYTITLTDNNNCAKSKSVVVIDTSDFMLSFEKTNVGCPGGNNGMDMVKISGGTAPFVYSWSSGHTDALATSLTAGNYTVTVTDSKGCMGIGTDKINEPDILNLIIQEKNSSCGKSDGWASVNVTGGTSPYTYAWSDGQNNKNAKNLASGIYDLIVTDNSGCVDSNQVIIEDKSSLVLDFTISEASCKDCYDGAMVANISGGTPPYKYLWSNGGTSANEKALRAGSYSIQVTDSAGCSAFDFLSIEVKK